MKAADGGHDYTSIRDESGDQNGDPIPEKSDQTTAEVTCEETDL